VTTALEGGCLCRAVRYHASGEPIAVVYCHCTWCRRATAAPVVAWAMFASERYELTAGEPAVHASSPGVERAFCARCGTQLSYRADYMPGLVDVTVGSLDDPHALPPQFHIWDSERLRWLELADGLPRHPDAPLPPGVGD
jgi:hypothetical protein